MKTLSYRRLAEVGDVIRGVSYNSQSSYDEEREGTLPILRAGNIQQDLITNKDLVFVSVTHVSDRQLIRENDIAMCMSSGSPAIVGKTAFSYKNEKSSVGAFCCIIRPKDIQPRYLFHFLNTDHFRIWTQSSQGINIKNIKANELKEFPIPYPPLGEQRRIAAILDKADAIRHKRQQALKLIDELVKSQFIEMFGDPVTNPMGWPVKRLEQITDSRLGKMLDAKKQTGRSRYPYLANFNVQWFRIDLENLNEMDFDEFDRLEFELRYGDLLICEGGEVGRTAIWKNQKADCFFQKALHRVRCHHDACIPEYLAWVMYQKATTTNFDGLVTSATIAHLTGEKLKGLMIQVPPLSLQNQFARFVEQADKSKFAMQRQLQEVETLKASLMQQFFCQA